MANNQNNLDGKGFESRTTEEQREIARKGGIASGRARAEKRDLRKALEMLLEQTFTDKKGNTKTGTQAVTERLFDEVMKGNVKAFEVLRDTVGQKPVEKVEQVNIDMEYKASVDYVKKLMEGREQ